AAATAPGAPAAPAGLKPLPDDQRRTYLMKAGFAPGSGRPTPEIIERARELAKADGFEWPAMGPGRERAGNSDAPIARTLYRLVGQGAAARPEAVNVKLGISDGTQTEVLEGLAEGDVVITGVIAGDAGTGGGNRPAANPFGGGPRRF
ncbi:MAG TPA: hypothetical protein VEQ65_11915, partial [Opitutus sp.]|nr:hypothetical protein [Opitutus sp.]